MLGLPSESFLHTDIICLCKHHSWDGADSMSLFSCDLQLAMTPSRTLTMLSVWSRCGAWRQRS